jgi:hypothetical protein
MSHLCSGKITMSLLTPEVLQQPVCGQLVQVCTSGRPFRGMEVRLIDDGGELVEVPPRLDADGRAVSRVGEIWIRGETVFAGYLQRDGQLSRDDFSDDGFFRTGDVGYVDSSGFITVCDRAKDMVRAWRRRARCFAADETPARTLSWHVPELGPHMHARSCRRCWWVERTCTAPRLNLRYPSTALSRRLLSLVCQTTLWARQSPARGPARG